MEFEPHRQLRRNVIKNALKASVVWAAYVKI